MMRESNIRGLELVRESTRIDDTLFDCTRRAAEFHGHLCPGLAIGIIASSIALTRGERAEDEELVAIVENDACGVDAIQALTGCTFGKGNLKYDDYGKSVFTFFYRNSGSAIRLSLKPDVYKNEDREMMNRYFDSVKKGIATESDTAEFWMNHTRRTREILERGEDIYTVTEIDMQAPESARIFDSVICDGCGEQVMTTRVRTVSGRALCIPCSSCARGETER
jgi:formylmethanofuran dehydrogenase subunit E